MKEDKEHTGRIIVLSLCFLFTIIISYTVGYNSKMGTFEDVPSAVAIQSIGETAVVEIVEEPTVRNKEELDKVLEIYKVNAKEPNSAGGVDVLFYAKNKSDKDIKYITFEIQPYNAVDDEVKCEISNLSIRRCELTGPISAGFKFDKAFENVWYNKTISYAKLLSIDIEYMDDSKDTISTNELKLLSDTKLVFNSDMPLY